MDAFPAAPDRKVGEIATRQHGVVTIEQLLWAGLTRTQVRRRATSGRLIRLYRGVYAVGHSDLSQEGRWFAGVAACGPRAVLSHNSAALLWGLTSSTCAVVHVTVPATSGRAKRAGIRLHYSRTLTARDTTRRHNVPVTTPARTRVDMGWTKEPTRSHLEREFLTLLRAHDLPLPSVNRRIGPYVVDFLWRERRLVVELDGYAYHSDRTSFEADRRRDRELAARGYVVIRFTYREVIEEPEMVAITVRRHLPTGRPGLPG